MSDGDVTQTGTLEDGYEGFADICNIDLGECFNFSISESPFSYVSGGVKKL